MNKSKADRGQLMAYGFTVLIAASGFWLIGHTADVEQARVQANAKVLCQGILKESAGNRVVIQSIVDLVVNSSPRRTPQEIIAADHSKEIILNFQKDAEAKLPVLDCNAIGRGEVP